MDFYYNLSESGVFFFWIIVFLILLLFILSIVLISKNKKLKSLIELNERREEIVPIVNEEKKKEIEVVPEETLTIEEEPKEVQKEEPKEEVKEEKIEISTPGAYQKNVLREMSRKMPTSPIHIERSEVEPESSIYTVTNSKEDNYDLDEIYLREDSVSPLEIMEDSYEVNDNMKFASEIVSRMEEEMKPSNIELTDYEKKQEEEAIISFDELEKVKDKIYNITEEEENDEFIDELKNFRLDLR